MENLKVLVFESDERFLKIINNHILDLLPNAVMDLAENFEVFCQKVQENASHVIITSMSAGPHIEKKLSELVGKIKEDNRPFGVLLLTDDHMEESKAPNFSASGFAPYISTTKKSSYEEELALFLENKKEYLKRKGNSQFKVQLRKRIHFPTFGEMSLDIHFLECHGTTEIFTKVENISIGGVGVKSKELRNEALVGKQFRVTIHLSEGCTMDMVAVLKHVGSNKRPFPGFQFAGVTGKNEKLLMNFLEKLAD